MYVSRSKITILVDRLDGHCWSDFYQILTGLQTTAVSTCEHLEYPAPRQHQSNKKTKENENFWDN